MEDLELMQRFEACTISGEELHHEQHVRLAWIYLRRLPVLQAIERFSEALRRFASAQGKPERYHETITWAYLFLVRERMLEPKPAETWQAFAQRHPDLLRWEGGLLRRYYRAETLASSFARSYFVLPDRGS